MTEWVYDDFNGNGQSITDNSTSANDVNTDCDTYSGTGGTIVFSSSAAYSGAYGLKLNSNNNYRMLEYPITDNGVVWVVFYTKLTNLPSANIYPVAFYGNNNTTYMGDVRFTTNGEIVIRDGAYTATSCTGVGVYAMDSATTWYRVAIMLDAANGDASAKIYIGDSSTAAWSDSDTSVTTGGQTAIDQIRIGNVQQGTVTDMYFDELHIGDAEWFPTAVDGNVDYDMSATYPLNSTTVETWRVDCRTSTGAVTLTQTSGTTASITESPTGYFTITNPTGTDTLGFDIEAAGSGGGNPETVGITINRGAGTGTTIQHPAIWVKASGAWV